MPRVRMSAPSERPPVNNMGSGGKEFNYIVRNHGASQAVIDKKINPIKPEPVK